MNRRPARLRAPRALAMVVTAALATATLAVVPAFSAAAAPAPVGPDRAVYQVHPESVPVLDSELGQGSAFGAGETRDVALPGLPEGTRSALVRISVLGAVGDVTVSAAGSPALSVAAGTSASTAVLLPVVDGHIDISTTAAADLRLETVATFAGDTDAAGSLIALDAPVSRLGGAGGAPARVELGVVGLGGVPATGVRAVVVTTTLDAPAAGSITIAGESLPVRAGVQSISTIAFPDGDGSVAVDTGAAALLGFDVRGWIPDAPQSEVGHVLPANIEGSFLPAPGLPTLEAATTERVVTRLPEPAVAEAATYLALVWADEVSTATVLSSGSDVTTRPAGAVADPAGGVQPQLALVDADDPGVVLRRGSATLGMLVLGAFVGADTTRSSALDVAVTSHRDGDTVDLAEAGGVVRLAGTVDDEGGTVASVVVRSGDTLIGSAAVRQTPSGSTWTLDTAVPASGDHTFTVTATDRDGRTATDEVELTVLLPDPDAPVVAEDVQVIDDAEIAPVTAVTDDTVTLACDLEVGPGGYLVAGVTPNAPAGLLRKVVAVDSVPGGTLVHTQPALLSDVVVQGRAGEDVLLGDAENTPLITPATPEEAGADEVLAGDEVPVWSGAANADFSDLAPVEGETEEIAGTTADRAAALTATAERSGPFAEPRLGASAEIGASGSIGFSAKFGYDKESGETTDASKKPSSEAKGTLSSKAKTSGGFYGEVSGTAKLALTVSVEITVSWSWGIPEPHLDFESAFTFSSEVKASFESYLAYTKEAKIKLATMKFAPIPMYLGVPVVVVPNVDLSLKATFTAKVSLGYEATKKVEKKAGVRCTDGRCERIDSQSAAPGVAPALTSLDSEASAGGSLELTVGPVFSASALLYDAAGPQLSVGLLLGGKASITAKMPSGSGSELTIELEAYLRLSASIGLVVKIPVFNVTLIDWTAVELVVKITLGKTTLTIPLGSGSSGGGPGGGGGGGGWGSSGPKPTPGDGPTRDAIDLMLVVDTTGSMYSYIYDAITNAKAIVDRLRDTAASPRVGLVEYKDLGDPFMARIVQPLTTDLDGLKSALDGLYANGGGDYPEAVYSGIVTGLSADWRPAAARALVVIGDAPAHDPEYPTGYTGTQVATMLAGTTACQNPEAEPIVGGPSLPLCAVPGLSAGSAGGPDGAPGFRAAAAPLVANGGLPVSLYGLSADPYELTPQLESLASASGGTVAEIGGAAGVGDGIIDAIEDAGAAPVPYFEWEPGGVATDLTFSADGTVVEGAASEYGWDFGDGSDPVVTSEPSVAHSFAEPGSYEVTLSVKDDRGRAAQITATVVVGSVELPWGELTGVGVEPSTVPLGGTVVVTVPGLAAGEPVSVALEGGTAAWTGSATDDGTAVVTIPIAVDGRVGDVPVSVSAPLSHLRTTAVFTVTALTPACPVG